MSNTMRFVLRFLGVISALVRLPWILMNKGVRELNAVESLLIKKILFDCNSDDRHGLSTQLEEVNLVSFNKYGSGYEIGFQKMRFLIFVSMHRRKRLAHHGETALGLWSGQSGNEKVLAKALLLNGVLSEIRLSKDRDILAAGTWTWTRVVGDSPANEACSNELGVPGLLP